jgi:hypothetical protein
MHERHRGGAPTFGCRWCRRGYVRRVGLAPLFTTLFFAVRTTAQLMTASMVHVTNLTPGSECNPTAAAEAAETTSAAENSAASARPRKLILWRAASSAPATAPRDEGTTAGDADEGEEEDGTAATAATLAATAKNRAPT